MKRRNVQFSEVFFADLDALHSEIAYAAGLSVANRYTDRIEAFCKGFDLAAERGTRRHDMLPGLRVVGFEKRVAILFLVEPENVLFLRAYYGGQNWETAFQIHQSYPDEP